MALLLEHATIVPAAHRAVLEGTDLLVVADRIAAIGPGLRGAAERLGAEVIDCRERLVIPGFVNAHTHSNESFEQGFYDALPLEVWLLWKYPPFAIPQLPERVHYLRTMLLAIESARSGISTVQDDLINQLSDPAAFDGAAAAYRDIGLRANITTSMWDKPFAESLLWTDELMDRALFGELQRLPAVGWREQIALFERHAAKWHGAGDGRLRVILGPVGPQWCSTELLQAATDISRSRGLPVHTHTLESKMHAVQAQVFYGRPLVEHLDSIGVLTPNFTLNHAIWLTDAEIDLLGARGACMTHNPSSNLKLGSGVARIPDLMRAGVPIGLGTDGTSTSDRADMFRSLGLTAMLHRIADLDYDTWVDAEDAFGFATTGAARTALLHDEIGSLEVGRKADLTLFDKTDYGLIPFKRPLAQLAYAVNSEAVRTLIVDGRVVMRERVLTGIDEGALKQEIRAEAERYARDHVPLMEAAAQRFAPYFRAAHLRAAATDVPASHAPVRLSCGCTAHPLRHTRFSG